MLVYTTTVVRGAELNQAGDIYQIDWDEKKVLRRIPVPLPLHPEAGPRGSRRGGRGICEWDGSLVVANYDALFFYDPDLNLQRKVTHPLFCGLHEIWAVPDGIWVSSTGIEALLLVDPGSGAIKREWYAPEEDALRQPPLSLEAREIDRDRDYRAVIYARSELITHTNCVSVYNGSVYATLSNKSAIVEILPEVKVRVLAPHLREPHNGLRLRDGRFIINDTGNQALRIFDPESGVEVKCIDLNRFSVKIKREGRALKGLLKISVPGWLRGLTQLDDRRVLVGISPSTVLEVDLEAEALLERLELSRDINNSIHGLYASSFVRPAPRT